MKKVSLAIIGCVLFAATAFASPNSEEVSGLSLNKADTALMFGDAKVVNIATLNAKEMKDTEGEWFWMPFVFRSSYTATRYLLTNGATMPATYYSIRSYF